MRGPEIRIKTTTQNKEKEEKKVRGAPPPGRENQKTKTKVKTNKKKRHIHRAGEKQNRSATVHSMRNPSPAHFLNAIINNNNNNNKKTEHTKTGLHQSTSALLHIETKIIIKTKQNRRREGGAQQHYAT